MTVTVDQTNQNFLKVYVEEYCKAITENYKRYHIASMERMLKENPECTYAANQLNDIQTGKANLMRFTYTVGKRYYKIIQEEFDTFQGRNEYRSGSVHSFVGRSKDILGNVYKPASWKAPHTKHVRFSFCDSNDFKKLIDPNFVGWAGGYLYLR